MAERGSMVMQGWTGGSQSTQCHGSPLISPEQALPGNAQGTLWQVQSTSNAFKKQSCASDRELSILVGVTGRSSHRDTAPILRNLVGGSPFGRAQAGRQRSLELPARLVERPRWRRGRIRCTKPRPSSKNGYLWNCLRDVIGAFHI